MRVSHIPLLSILSSHVRFRLGFSVTAVILGGQTLASINPDTLPLVVGIIIVAICSLIPCFVGYELVHVYERYAWMVISVVMLFLWGLGGHAGFHPSAQKPLEDTGRALSADILSFGGIVFGSFSGVCTTSIYPVGWFLIALFSGHQLQQTTIAGFRLTPQE